MGRAHIHERVGSLNPIDALVGERLRQRRKALKMSQAQLGGMLGVSFQQIQKYEKGVNKIAASTLFMLAQALGVEPAFFFAPAPELAVAEGAPPTFVEGRGTVAIPLDDDDARRISDAFQHIKSARVRRSIIAMIEAVTDAS